MTFQLPPSNQPPSKNERFYAFLSRNASKHGMPALPSSFDDLEFYWAWHENRPGHNQPFMMDMGEIARKAMENPAMEQSSTDFAFRAAAASEGSRTVLCYDTPDALESGPDKTLWLEKVSLKELVFQCAANGLGAVFFSQRRMFQLSPGTVFKLTGLQVPTEQTKDVGLPEDLEFGPSGLSEERQQLFRELIARNDDWIEPDTIEFVRCKAGDGNTYEGITFTVKTGTPESRVTRECSLLGQAITVVTNEPFAVMPRSSIDPPFGFDR